MKKERLQALFDAMRRAPALPFPGTTDIGEFRQNLDAFFERERVKDAAKPEAIRAAIAAEEQRMASGEGLFSEIAQRLRELRHAKTPEPKPT